MEKDKINIINNVNKKFLSWEWNYGESPPFTFENTILIKEYLWHIEIEVKDGLISKCELFKDGKLFNHELVSVRYGPEYLFDLINFLDKDDVFNLFFGKNNLK